MYRTIKNYLGTERKVNPVLEPNVNIRRIKIIYR